MNFLITIHTQNPNLCKAEDEPEDEYNKRVEFWTEKQLLAASITDRDRNQVMRLESAAFATPEERKSALIGLTSLITEAISKRTESEKIDPCFV